MKVKGGDHRGRVAVTVRERWEPKIVLYEAGERVKFKLGGINMVPARVRRDDQRGTRGPRLI
jgi:hypothetical protein